MSALYAWLRRHPRLVDAVPAVFLTLGGVATAVGNRTYWLIPVTFGLTVPMVFRRAHPVGAFCVAMAAGAFQVLIAWTRPLFVPADLAVVVLLYTLAAYTTRKISIAGLAACLLGAAVAGAEISHHLVNAGIAAPAAFGAGVLAGPCLLAWVIGDSMRYRRAYYVNLEERAAQLERDRDVQAQMAAAAERARIARELHDVVAHNVSVMIVQADGAAYAMAHDPDRARQALAAISATGRQALTEMRVMLGVLRKSDQTASAIADEKAMAIADATAGAIAAGAAEAGASLATIAREAAAAAAQAVVSPIPVSAAPPGHLPAWPGSELAPMPGIGQLDDLLDQVRAGGLGVSCTMQGQVRPLPSGIELTAYRIIQESLTNTRRHAGEDARADVKLRYLHDAIEVTVTDNGVGAAAPCDGAGHGLTGMRERVALYGGTLAVGPLPGRGFRVRARLPDVPPQADIPLSELTRAGEQTV